MGEESTQRLLPSTRYDQQEDGSLKSLGPFFENITSDAFPSLSLKFHVTLGAIWDMRTSYCTCAIFYINGQYIKIAKSIINDQTLPVYITYEKGQKKTRRTTISLIYNINILTPINKDLCYMSQVSLLNIGGVLKLVSETIFKNTLGSINVKLQKSLADDLRKMRTEADPSVREGFQVARECLRRTLEQAGKTIEDSPFPDTFEKTLPGS